MLGLGLMLFCLKGLAARSRWKPGILAVAFWAINLGFGLMVLLSVLPVGLLQAWASLEHGMWYARSPEFLQTELMDTLRWLRVVGDTLFAIGAVAFAWFVLGLKAGWSLASPQSDLPEAGGGRLCRFPCPPFRVHLDRNRQPAVYAGSSVDVGRPGNSTSHGSESIVAQTATRPSAAAPAAVSVAYETAGGRLFVGRSEDVLSSPALDPWRGRVQLVFTSPPFPLLRQKKYGNLSGDAYADWLAGFANPLTEFLTPDGSIVIELGNGWNPGTPTVSTVGIKALLAFQEAAGLHLCQEFICYNPARLPTPAEWVAVRRTRVKDAFTRVWWLSPTPSPKADNRRVLTEYSESMRKLLRKGTYTGGRRPSEHQIGGRSFLADNGGSIPPNVLVPPADAVEPQAVLPIANTASKGGYHQVCRKRNVPRHPAAMPESLVDFFAKFLTDPGDVILDPFAGSNTTGAVAEKLGREWVSIETDPEYASASRVRFGIGDEALEPAAAVNR